MPVSAAAVKRLPEYLTYLRSLPPDKYTNISSAAIASALGYVEIQVRKDLSSVSGKGKPKVGYVISDLITELENFLGYNNNKNAVVVGCGRLGMAIIDYNGFGEYGINISAGFETDANKSGLSESGKNILPMSELSDFCENVKIVLGILCVPAVNAQEACECMMNAGIKAILNFAPVCLSVPDNVKLKNVNIAAQFAELANSLGENPLNSVKNESEDYI